MRVRRKSRPFRPDILRITREIVYLAGQVLDRSGTGMMPYYRLYFLDRFTGHIRTAENLYAADDGDAAEQVRERDLAEPLELWCGGRKVARFEAGPEFAAKGREARA